MIALDPDDDNRSLNQFRVVVQGRHELGGWHRVLKKLQVTCGIV